MSHFDTPQVILDIFFIMLDKILKNVEFLFIIFKPQSFIRAADRHTTGQFLSIFVILSDAFEYFPSFLNLFSPIFVLF